MGSHIGVDSYFELYTTIFGWYQYNNIWQILTDTGLVFLPFFGLLLRNFIEPVQSQKSKQSQLTSLKGVEIQLFLMLTVVILGGQPMITVQTNELKFVQLCVSSEQGFISRTHDFEKDQSLYKKAGFMKADDRAKVPVWWYAVMSVSSGFNYALKNTLPCLRDVRFLRASINKARIKDSALQYELMYFLNDCFYPSHSFLTLTKDQRLAHPGWGESDEAKYAKIDDQQHKGLNRQLLLSPRLMAPGKYLYYGRRATIQVAAMKIPNDDSSYEYHYGRPLCAHWWGDPKNPGPYYQNSLSVRLKNHLKETSGKLLELHAYPDVLDKVVVTSQDLDHYKKLYTTQNDLMEGSSGSRSSIGKMWDVSVGFFGMLFKAMQTYPVVYATQQVAFVAQSLLLLGIYMTIPIALVVSGFSYQFLIIGALAIFCLKFISYTFHVAWWLDRNLYIAVKGPPPDGYFEFLYHSIITTGEEFKINFITLGMYFLLPGLTVMVFSWAGIKVLGGLDSLYDKLGGMGSSAGEAGRAGGAMGQSVLGHAGRIGLRMLARKGMGKSGKDSRYTS